MESKNPQASYPKAIISVVNWNNFKNTLACVGALLKLEYTNYRIIVVDNGSQDKSVGEISVAFPDITLIRSETNLGFAGGHRLALEIALQDDDARLFWMLNNDAFVEPATLTEFVKTYDLYGEALYGGLPVSTKTGKIEALWGYPLTDTGQPDRQVPLDRFIGTSVDEAFPEKKSLFTTEVHGSSFVVPMSVIRKYGFLDQSFFLYGEEGITVTV